MISYILKTTIFKNRLTFIEHKRTLYQKITNKKDIEKYQIEQFNKIWNKAITHNPFYKMWQKNIIYQAISKNKKILRVNYLPK